MYVVYILHFALVSIGALYIRRLFYINSDIIYDKNRTYKFWTNALYIHVGQRVSQC